MLAAAGAIGQDIFQFQGVDSIVNGAKMSGAHDAIIAASQNGNQKAL